MRAQEVLRYDISSSGMGISERNDGGYVRHADYAALAEELKDTQDKFNKMDEYAVHNLQQRSLLIEECDALKASRDELVRTLDLTQDALRLCYDADAKGYIVPNEALEAVLEVVVEALKKYRGE